MSYCNCDDVEWDTEMQNDINASVVYYNGKCKEHGHVRQYAVFDDYFIVMDERNGFEVEQQ